MHLQSSCVATALLLQRLAQAHHFCEVHAGLHAGSVPGAGSTDTSLWTHYAAGEREYCGNAFPDGMRKNDQLEQNVITPTTKSASHDVPISAEEVVRQGLMTPAEWDEVGL